MIRIGNREIGPGRPVYFIAEIGANHDGDLDRALQLIHLAASYGTDAVKFQHFRAETIVSRRGFEDLGQQLSHQEHWDKPVYQVYEEASLPSEWTPELKAACDAAHVEFLSSPYDRQSVDLLEPYVNAYKIGSGEITWLDQLRYIAAKDKPIILSTGASSMREVGRAVKTILEINESLALLQCNTNYTGSLENTSYLNLRVLSTYAREFPSAVLGFSDHSPSSLAVLGAIALGASIVEKHFTDDPARDGPDHPFALNPRAWWEMVLRVRELEQALGDGVKLVETNEKDTVVIQRRSLRAVRTMEAGHVLVESDLEALRPAPLDAVTPWVEVAGRSLRCVLEQGDYLRWEHLREYDAEQEYIL